MENKPNWTLCFVRSNVGTMKSTLTVLVQCPCYILNTSGTPVSLGTQVLQNRDHT